MKNHFDCVHKHNETILPFKPCNKHLQPRHYTKYTQNYWNGSDHSASLIYMKKTLENAEKKNVSLAIDDLSCDNRS